MSLLARSAVSSVFAAAAALAFADGARAIGDGEEFRTLRVGILAYEGVEMLDFAGPVEVFECAGNQLSLRGKPLFEVVTIAPGAGAVMASGGVTIEPRCTVADRPRLDVLVIPGGETGELDRDAAFLAWLRETAAGDTLVMSVCNAAFVLAKIGLLDGKEATTCHGFLGFLEQEAPKCRVLSGRRVVDNGRILTAGGVSCGIDGALHVVARIGGRKLADTVAAGMEYRWTPEPQLEGSYSEWTTVGGDRLELEQQLRWHRRRSHWPEAEKAARGITELAPDDGFAWYAFGVALLAQRKLDEAIEVFEESARHPGRRPSALYNVACAWACKSEKGKSLDALARAADAAWDDRGQTEKDADLAPLRGDPRFVALLERIGAQGASGRPEWERATLVRAKEAIDADDPGDALQVFVNAMNLAPENDAVRSALESALAREGAPESIVRTARRVLAAHPRPAKVAPAPAKASSGPRRVALVLFDGIPLLELVGPAQLLDSVPGFRSYTVAASRAPVHCDEATLVPDFTFEDAPPPDVIVVTSGSGLGDAALREWLRRFGPTAQAVLSDCNGALVLANAGLLDGRAATCPTGNLDGLLLLGKDVHPYRGRRFVRDGNVVTSDSYFAGVDGALEVVSMLCGAAEAELSANRSLYSWRPKDLDSSHPSGGEAPPSHFLAVFRVLLESGPEAATATFEEWRSHGGSERIGPADEWREQGGFHILGWTLERAGRKDDALRLCKWTADTFPESALAIACLGEAYFECDRFEEALPTLIEADEKEHGQRRALEVLQALLHHKDLVANDDSRRARELLRERATASTATLTPKDETGERMVIHGVVRDAAGSPIGGARLEVFQADASGRYTTSSAMDEKDARLFAFLRSDDAGRYEFTSVRPGGYPQPRTDVSADAGDERFVPQHVHVVVEAPGHATRRLQIVFRDDPRMTEHWRKWASERCNPVVELARDGAGTLRGACDVTLR